MNPALFIILLLLYSLDSFSQETDTSKTLDEVTVRAFEQNRKPSSTTAAVRILTISNGDRNNKTSLVNGFNTIAGVRMEERSPGSYRINIRGSSLRSPFGVRNVKVYWNDIPVTDPGGNTYFNQFAYNNFSTIEIFKGPAGSLYGAGTGGLILINNLDRWQRGASVEYMTGSYGLNNLFASASFGKGDNKNHMSYALNESDGYRAQSAMHRNNFSWASQLKISDRQQLTASLLYTDLFYETPGALTLNEYNNNPKAARPAAGPFPSAEAINAAIYQKNFLAGFSNRYNIADKFRNITTLYGAYAQIKNSAIRNYERRNEPHFGGRSSFIYSSKFDKTDLQLVAGGEFQQGYFNTLVSRNKNGNPDTVQTNDDINYTSYNAFLQADVNMNDKWLLTAGVSLNKSKVNIRRLNIYPVLQKSVSYKNEFTPRISLLHKFTDDLSLLATVSSGFSPPSTVELLPSTSEISTGLQAEKGTNYELTARYHLRQKQLYFEATGFYFRLHDALVQLRDLSGADYFTNAGEIKEKGLELHGDYTYTPGGNIIDNIILQADYTYNDFRYGSYKKDTSNFSGHRVPSVPSNILSATADVMLRCGFYLSLSYYSSSKIFLNDANSFSAKPYHLLGSRMGWKKTFSKKYRLNIYVGADNLLDETYSLGNDINAAANRFYNAAPKRNYYVGLQLQWVKKA